MNAGRKQESELKIFSIFTSIAGLEVEPGSISQPEPPEPDIACRINGEPRRFELTIAADEGLERKLGSGQRGYTNFRVDIDDVLDRIEGKVGKYYPEGPVIELVVHEGSAPLRRLFDYDEQVVASRFLLALNNSRFRSVWIVDITGRQVRCFSNPGYRVSNNHG